MPDESAHSPPPVPHVGDTPPLAPDGFPVRPPPNGVTDDYELAKLQLIKVYKDAEAVRCRADRESSDAAWSRCDALVAFLHDWPGYHDKTIRALEERLGIKRTTLNTHETLGKRFPPEVRAAIRHGYRTIREAWRLAARWGADEAKRLEVALGFLQRPGLKGGEVLAAMEREAPKGKGDSGVERTPTDQGLSKRADNIAAAIAELGKTNPGAASSVAGRLVRETLKIVPAEKAAQQLIPLFTNLDALPVADMGYDNLRTIAEGLRAQLDRVLAELTRRDKEKLNETPTTEEEDTADADEEIDEDQDEDADEEEVA